MRTVRRLIGGAAVHIRKAHPKSGSCFSIQRLICDG
jgi:hypothetical protein